MENRLYPLKFHPVFMEKIWGGTNIKNKLGYDIGEAINCGEMWSLSGYSEQQSIVANGFLANRKLNDLIEIYKGELLGSEIFNTFGAHFPILVKIIDTNDWLSIQVHPGDELARKRRLNGGKTEMWYVIDAQKDSELISGFKKDVSQSSLKKKIDSKKLEELLNFVKVCKGDVFYLPSGKIHALGPGILLAEIQQTSDTTYRIYDWDRADKNGKKRDLHIDEAMEAIDFNASKEHKISYSKTMNSVNIVLNTPYFTTNMLHINSKVEKEYDKLDSFVILLCVAGIIKYDDLNGNTGELRVGECLLAPAILKHLALEPIVECKILEVYIASA